MNLKEKIEMKKIVVLLLSLMFIYGCIEDSALSDVDLENPSLIRPMIEVYKHTSSGSSSVQHIAVFLYDKNDNLIKLQNGKVFVNGNEMVLKDIILTDAKYYSGTEVIGNVKFPENYIFDVVLTDDKTYRSTVLTQAVELTELNAPVRHPKIHDLRLSWNKTDIKNPLTLEMLVDYTENDTNKTSAYKIEIPTNNINEASYIISSQYFTNNPNSYKVYLNLVSETSGVMNNNFRSGGSIKSINSISRNVSLD